MTFSTDILTQIQNIRTKFNLPNDPKIKPLSDLEKSRLPKLPNGWIWLTSNEISTFITNGVHAPTSLNDELGINKKMLRITDLKEGREPNFNNLPYCKRFVKGDYEKTIKKNDIYISFTGNNLGKRYLVKQDNDNVVFAHYFVRWQPLVVNPVYIYYVLLSPHFDRFMYEHTLGSTQPNLKVTDLKRMPLPIPPLEIQDRIANLLSKYDEKIEINNAIIIKIEEIVQTLFKRWFIDIEFPNEEGLPYKSSGGKMIDSELGEIPDGWSVGALHDISTIIMGQSPKSDTYNSDGIGLPLINGASDFKGGDINPKKYTTDPKKVSQYGDYIFGVRATLGNVTETNKEYAIGRGAGIARAKEDKFKEYLYFQLINAFNTFEQTASGSVYLNISKNDLNDFKVIVPSEDIIEKFHLLTESMFRKKNLLFQENKKLAMLKDTLIIKIFSGEIEIPDESVVV